MKLVMAGKDHRKIMTAIGRELLGFIWAIAIKAEPTSNNQLLNKRQNQNLEQSQLLSRRLP